MPCGDHQITPLEKLIPIKRYDVNLPFGRSLIPTKEEELATKIALLEERLAAAERVIDEARPLAEVLDKGATLIGGTLIVSSALSRAIASYDRERKR